MILVEMGIIINSILSRHSAADSMVSSRRTSGRRSALFSTDGLVHLVVIIACLTALQLLQVDAITATIPAKCLAYTTIYGPSFVNTACIKYGCYYSWVGEPDCPPQTASKKWYLKSGTGCVSCSCSNMDPISPSCAAAWICDNSWCGRCGHTCCYDSVKQDFLGYHCTRCAANTYGESCLACPNCNAGVCNADVNGNGQCTCNTGASGANCNVCASGQYGPNCKLCQSCNQGTCQDGFTGSGACTCNGNWVDVKFADGSTVSCSDCKAGYYGPTCTGVCPACAKGSSCNQGKNGDGKCTTSSSSPGVTSTSSGSSGSSSHMVAIGSAIGGCVALLAVIAIALVYRARVAKTVILHSRGSMVTKVANDSLDAIGHLDIESPPYGYAHAMTPLSAISGINAGAGSSDEAFVFDEIPRDQIRLGDKIGSGNFGDVWRGILDPMGTVTAVKSLKDGATYEENKLFIMEAKLMAELRHPNIVRIIGIVTHGKPPLLVLEFMSNGSLLSYLESKGENLSRKTLMCMCRDVAAGMVVLECRGFVHRDLAARNILVDSDGTCKIADFGLARQLSSDYYMSSLSQKIPIRWTPPEAIEFGKYSSASDVWAFGVVCWEVFSLGEMPYGQMTNNEARDIVKKGGRLAMPKMADARIYATMLSCWAVEPRDRPQFIKLFSDFQGMILGQSHLPSGAGEGFLKHDPTETYALYESLTPVISTECAAGSGRP